VLLRLSNLRAAALLPAAKRALAAAPPASAMAAALATDGAGRAALSVAPAALKPLLERIAYLCGRYDVLRDDPREHQSETCRVLFARDVAAGAGADERVVALKFMRDGAQFAREVGARAGGGGARALSPAHVLRVLRTHAVGADAGLAAAFARAGAGAFPFLVVLPAAVKNFDAFISSVRAAPDWPARARAEARALTAALAHVHAAGVVHGDVKPRNAVRDSDGVLRLIDLDGAVRVGERGAGAKLSTAFAPPELAAALAADARATLVAAPSFDAWALGVTLHRAVTGQLPFMSDDYDNLAAPGDLARLAAWSGAPLDGPLFAPRVDRFARDLVVRLLERDPARRLLPADALAHRYFEPDGPAPARLPTEAPKWDVFISYRRASDWAHAAALHARLTAAGLRVWWDEVEMPAHGAPVDIHATIFAGLARARLFVPLVSRGAVNDAATPAYFWPALTADMALDDNVLVEWRGAREMRERGLLEAGVLPLFAGAAEGGVHANWFADEAANAPAVPDVVVAAVEDHVARQLRDAGLGAPLCADRSARATWRAVRSVLGKCIAGRAPACYDDAVARVREVIAADDAARAGRLP